MTINAQSRWAGFVVIAVVAVLLGAATAGGFRRAVAWWYARTPSLENFQAAAKWDPQNAEHHIRLGRFYQYSVEHIDADLALTHFAEAVRLNPYDARGWLELGAALQLEGRVQEAEACLRRADVLAPHIPSIQWAIGNFFLLQGGVDEAFHHFRAVLAGSMGYSQSIFRTAWKASDDPEEILEKLIPRHLPTEVGYLNYLVGADELAAADTVWARVVGTGEPVAPPHAARYFDSLIQARRLADAEVVWMDLIRMGSIKSTYEPHGGNLIVNGAFEEELLRMGFDWRIPRVEGVYSGPDGTIFRSPGTSLLIQFTGDQNVHYRHLFQYVRVQPGRTYRLHCMVRTEEITTDSGPRLEVRDAYDPATLRVLSEDLTGTTMGWTQLALEFATGRSTELVVVSITRLPSRKLDNLIRGKMWVDDFSLVILPAERRTRR